MIKSAEPALAPASAGAVRPNATTASVEAPCCPSATFNTVLLALSVFKTVGLALPRSDVALADAVLDTLLEALELVEFASLFILAPCCPMPPSTTFLLDVSDTLALCDSLLVTLPLKDGDSEPEPETLTLGDTLPLDDSVLAR